MRIKRIIVYLLFWMQVIYYGTCILLSACKSIERLKKWFILLEDVG